MQPESITGPIATVTIICIFVALLTFVAHAAFGLISWLPANVIRWIGQLRSDLGEGGGASGARGAVAAVGASQQRQAAAGAAAPRKKPALPHHHGAGKR